jgi:flagellar assembly factor FliW
MNIKLTEYEQQLVNEVKKNFNLKADKNVGKIACYMITQDTENKISANRKATLIVMMKNEVGLQCNCSGNCISWYKDKLKKGKLTKPETLEEKQARLKNELALIDKKLQTK